PDRSKQRESSAEPTSGSAGPVPEKRDPRLAVAREAEPSKDRGRVDTATRVLSTRDGSSAEGEGHLREAVAAWVRSAEPDEEPPAGRDTDTDAGAPAVPDAGTAPEAPDASEDHADGPESTEGEAGAGTAQSAAPASGAPRGPETPAGAAPDASDTDTASDVADASEDTGGETPTASPDDAPRDEDATRGTAAATGTTEGAEGETPAVTAPSAAPKGASPRAPQTPTETAPDASDAEDGTPAGTAKTGTPASGASRDEDGSASATDTNASGDSGGGRGSTAADGADGDGRPKAKEPVDQPTAVFRTGRASAPAVDQPTTMLKLGDVARPEADAERTSRFVALKRDEDLGGRKPPAAPTGPNGPTGPTTALPQVGPERTTQQPLPPKPPLDLLAELTNTPPPPQTPLRTAVRRVKIWTPLVLLLVIVFAVVQYVRPLPAASLTLTVQDSYTFEGGKLSLPWPTEGQGWMDVNGIGTMDSHGDQKPVAIGSVAKAMTAYVVLKEHRLKSGEEGPDVPVDATAEKEGSYDSEGESTLNTVNEGDKLTLRQAISAIMIPSANNIARLLARWDAGSETEFIQKMNDTAKELGMENTTYTDASGLKDTTVSTAEDQVKLGNELVKMPALMEITKLPEWTDPSGKKWRNYNTLVPYNNALGIKTGSTTKAGGNLLFAGTKEAGGETVTVVGAVLGQHQAPIIDTVNAVSKTALLAAQNAIVSAKIVRKGDVVGYVDDKMGGRSPVVVTKDVQAVGWAGLTVRLSFAPSDVPHTAKAGTAVGTLTVGDGSNGAVKVPVALQEDLVEPGFTDKLTRIA
ncbi:D-alanyl-D-alanine carboxypeptidase, partial [Streptomyces sp. NPDC004976]